jgi:purine-binding chemotaxis protein CheW
MHMRNYIAPREFIKQIQIPGGELHMQAVVFSVNGRMFGISTAQVKEILRYHDVEKSVGMPEYMEGMINLRGSVIPIISLYKRFNLGQTKAGEEKIIICDVKNNSIGFKVDDVSEIIRFSPEDLQEVPEILNYSENRYLKHIAKKADKLISIIDPGEILTSSEVKEVVEKAQ